MTAGGAKLKAGEVVRIRVNPKDCLSVLDVLDAANINYKAMSYSQCVSLALASLLETVRVNKIIPDPDGFDYLERMSMFKVHNSATQKKKLEITGAMQELGSRLHVPAVTDELVHSGSIEVGMSPDQKRAGRLLAELDAKRELAAENPHVTFDENDWHEFKRLYQIVYQEEWRG